MIEISPNGPLSEADLGQAEATLGSRFPEPYRSWLSATGGGNVDDLSMPDAAGDGVLLEFLSASEIARRRGQGFDVTIPNEYVAIAAGAGGTVALRIAEPDRGAIYWADYDKAIELYDDGVIEEDDATEDIMSELAAGWNEFLASR